MNGPQGVQTTELIKRERCVREPHSQLNRRPQNHKKYLIFKYEDPRLGELEHTLEMQISLLAGMPVTVTTLVQ